MFQMQSDTFFEMYDPVAVLGGPIDLAFLDGMHLFEYLLRDFIHTERACHAGSMVVLHDCVPIDPFMATRDSEDKAIRNKSRQPLWWTGDVWKVVAILQHYRPDLVITLFDAPPTGLVVVTHLDRANRTLSEQYNAILSPEPDCAWHTENIGRYLSDVALVPTSKMLDYLMRP
jgi:hypothetical protein